MDEKLIDRLIDERLFDYTSHELEQAAMDLHLLNGNEPLAEFWDRFDFGNWLYEEMTLLDINIVGKITELAVARRKEEEQELKDRQLCI